MRNLVLIASGLSLVGSSLFSIADGALSNDAAADATSIATLPFYETLDGTLATLETDEPQPNAAAQGSLCPELGSSVWYRYTPAVDAELRVSMFGSTGDPAFAVWSGGAGETLLRCNDDIAPGSPIASAPMTVRGGVELFLQIGHKPGAAGVTGFALDELATIPPPCSGPSCSTFRVYDLPGPMGGNAGETNIGVNLRTNTAMLLLLGRAVTATFDDVGVATYDDVTTPLLSTTNDPILWTDPDTGRTIVAQLKARVGSVIGFTDDDGATWQIAEPGVVLPSWDHQSVGGGPYPTSLRGRNPVYPNAIYYCAQTGVAASHCARSDNGGLTWLGPFPMNVAACSGLHGHIAVSPVTGAVVVPHKSCGGDQGVVVSSDAGTTWSAREVSGTAPSPYDPAVAFDRSGKLYMLMSSDGRPMVSVSGDDGTSWTPPTDLGAQFGIANTAFPMAVAGDDGRAAVAFYGTTMPGNDQAGFFDGAWHVYIATTTDAGATWSVTDATPTDPVQRGCIWMSGGSNPCRNLLDFQGMAIDAEGRVLVSIADGCVRLGADCAGPAGAVYMSRVDRAAIIRQVDGPRLFR